MKTFETISLKQLWKALCFLLLMSAMIYGGLAQETLPNSEDDPSEPPELLKANADPDKSTPIMLNVVGGGARIHGLTVGRGGGNKDTNSAFGTSALFNNTSGSANTAIGYASLFYNTSGSSNTAIGRNSLCFNTTGVGNTAIGMAALFKNTTGYHNIALGTYALTNNTTGYFNTALGNDALNSNTTGNRNTATGRRALYKNEGGNDNTATGFEALQKNTSGDRNTATGYQALNENTTGYYNTATGTGALRDNTTGYRNTAIGQGALQNNTTQRDNTAVGYGAGYTHIGFYCTYLGVYAHANTADKWNATGIGYYARTTGSDQVRIGNSTMNSIGGYAGWSNLSDGYYKTNVMEDVAGLEFVLRLRPVSYNLDVHKLAADLEEDIIIDEEGNKTMSAPDEIIIKSRDEKSAVRYTGFIAQEVEATVNELRVAFSGVDAPTNKESHYGLRYADFVVPLVKAVQEQQAQIELLEPAAVEALQQELQELNRFNAEIQKRLENVEAENEIMKDQLSQILSLLKEQGVDLGGITTSDPSRPGGGRSGRNTTTQGACLEQNTPNPFHENTVVRYYVPENMGKAQILVTDLQGNRVQILDINGGGYGQVTIQGGSLPAGTYVYSLLINGQLSDSKRMVLLL